MRKPPTIRNNNGALQVRVRLEGMDYFINRLGEFDDPVARALAISAEIWSDFQQGDLDQTLNRYRPLVEGKDLDLLDGLKELMERTKQARVIHTYRTVLRFGFPLETNQDARSFVEWMDERGLAPSTQATILVYLCVVEQFEL